MQSRILGLLFPDVALEDLNGKTRPQLLTLLSEQRSPSDNRIHDVPPEVHMEGMPPQPYSPDHQPDDSAAVSDSGETEDERRWDEVVVQPANLPASDDINAIGSFLATDRHRRSYLGVTSMS